jgi:hypothetical protein
MKELTETGSVRIYGEELTSLMESLTLDLDVYTYGIIETNQGYCLEIIRFAD